MRLLQSICPLLLHPDSIYLHLARREMLDKESERLVVLIRKRMISWDGAVLYCSYIASAFSHSAFKVHLLYVFPISVVISS